MNVNVVEYNERNGAQIKDAKEVIDRILKDGVDDIKILLDVGCGSGNVTQLVFESIPHETMYCFDIDPKMVAHSKKLNENNVEKIQFFIQDIGAPWASLHKTLLELEGKVDLVWSNRVLHWVPDELRPRAAQNIVRLLRPGGRLYINTTYTNDPWPPSVAPEVRAENEKLLKVPSKAEQTKFWTHYFSGIGLSSLNVEYFEKEWDSGSHEKFLELRNYFHFWKRYIPRNIPAERHDEILEGLSDTMLKSIGHPIGQPPVNPLETLTIWYYGQFRIIGVK